MGKPLYLAAEYGRADVVKTLLDAGADHTKATHYANEGVAELLRKTKVE